MAAAPLCLALTVVLNHQILTLVVALGTFFVTGYLYVEIPKGFFPIQDTGVIQGITQASQAISFETWRVCSRISPKRS